MRRFATTSQVSLFALGALFAFSLPAQKVSAAIIQVDEACGLHDAIVAANTDNPAGGCPAGAGADTITLDHDIALTESLPFITSEIILQGRGHSISGANAFQIFSVGRGGKLIVNDLKMIDGDAWVGGAISVHTGGEVAVSNSVFSRNAAVAGGAIALLRGHATVTSSRFTGNHAADEGGAIWTYQKENLVHIEGSSFYGNTAGVRGGAFHSTLSDLTLVNTTISGNSASQGGGMYFIKFAAGPTKRVSLRHVTMAENHALDGEAIGGGAILHISNSMVMGSTDESRCYLQSPPAANLIEDGRCDADVIDGDPMLANFMREGGYHPLLQGSPAIDSADPKFCPPTDQLGNPRPGGDSCDLGAIEYMGASS